jgi:transposase
MEEQRKLNIKYQIDLKIAKKNSGKISKRDYKLAPNIYSNGDDEKQLLTRSRYLLYKYEDQWNTNQVKRADLLFSKYPELMDAYVLILEFRDWYSQINIGESRGKLEGKLLDWIVAIRKINSTYFKALATSIKRHRGQILNYFIGGYTNASAEALNRNLKRFIGVNYGIRNLNFFYFRLNLLHASTSN